MKGNSQSATKTLWGAPAKNADLTLYAQNQIWAAVAENTLADVFGNDWRDKTRFAQFGYMMQFEKDGWSCHFRIVLDTMSTVLRFKEKTADHPCGRPADIVIWDDGAIKSVWHKKEDSFHSDKAGEPYALEFHRNTGKVSVALYGPVEISKVDPYEMPERIEYNSEGAVVGGTHRGSNRSDTEINDMVSAFKAHHLETLCGEIVAIPAKSGNFIGKPLSGTNRQGLDK